MEQNIPEITEDRFSAARLLSVLQDVLRRWYLILVVALAAGMGMFILKDMTYVPSYSASTTFVISTGGTSSSTFQNLSATKDLAEVFTEVLNSSLLQEKVLEQVGISSFDGSIQASAVPETNLLTMTVRGPDPRTVFLVSKAVQEHHGIVSEQLLEGVILEVLKQPRVPVYPNNPLNLRDTVKKTAILAGMLTALLAAVLSFLSDKVRSRTEADYKLRCRVLGELYHEKKFKTLRDKLTRKKNSILISNPTTSFGYTESVNKLAGRIDKHLHRDEKIVMVTSFLENEGKSTVAANLALSMARRGRTVLLLDADLRKPSAALVMNVSVSGPGLGEVLTGKAEFSQAVRPVGDTGVFVLSGKKGIRAAGELVISSAMRELLRQVSGLYDCVIVDTPPMALAPDAEYLSGHCDASVLVVRQNNALASDLNRCVDILEKTGSHMVGCVLNNVRGSGSFAPAFQYGAYRNYDKRGYGKYGYGRYGYGPDKEE